MFIVNLGWTIFRSPDLVSAGHFIKSMFGVGTYAIWSNQVIMFLKEYGIFFVAAIIFSIPIGKRCNKLIVEKKVAAIGFDMIYPVLMIGIFLIGVTYLVKGSYNPFIYFNF